MVGQNFQIISAAAIGEVSSVVPSCDYLFGLYKVNPELAVILWNLLLLSPKIVKFNKVLQIAAPTEKVHIELHLFLDVDLIPLLVEGLEFF